MTSKRVLDLYCGLGGASDGYAKAGLLPTGVDRERQSRYPYDFIRADAIDVLEDAEFLRMFDLIHASPPCQGYVDGYPRGSLYATRYAEGGKHARQIQTVREKLRDYNYVIENVDTAPLDPDRTVLLCGTWFREDMQKYGVIRHRIFETNWCLHDSGIFAECGTALCLCDWPRYPRIGDGGWVTVAGGTGPEYRLPEVVADYEANGVDCGIGAYVARIALGMDRGTKVELNECVPPAYTELIGKVFLDRV